MGLTSAEFINLVRVGNGEVTGAEVDEECILTPETNIKFIGCTFKGHLKINFKIAFDATIHGGEAQLIEFDGVANEIRVQYINIIDTIAFMPNCGAALVVVGPTVSAPFLRTEHYKQIETFRISNSTIDKIELLGSKQVIEIVQSSIKRKIFIDLGTCETLRLEQITDNKELRIGSGADKNFKASDISLRICNTERLDIKKITCDDLQILGCSIGNLTIDPVHIGKLTLNKFLKVDVDPNIQADLKVSKLTLKAWNNSQSSKISISSLVDLDSFIAEDLNYIESAFISGFSVKGLFSLKNSSFIKSKFNNLDLYDCREVDFYKTFIQDCDFVNITWPRSYEIKEEGYSRFSIRETYRQLKKISLGQNNKIDALEFSKRELLFQYKILKQKVWSKRKLTLANIMTWWANFGNYLIVGTHKWFSNFSLSIWRPVLFLFGVHVVLFNMLLCFRPAIGMEIWLCSISWDGVEMYFQTILPTHAATVKNLSGQDVFIGGVIDFLMRISSGYFIFYFISASRKYHQ